MHKYTYVLFFFSSCPLPQDPTSNSILLLPVNIYKATSEDILYKVTSEDILLFIDPPLVFHFLIHCLHTVRTQSYDVILLPL